jgi:hypothetical protein
MAATLPFPTGKAFSHVAPEGVVYQRRKRDCFCAKQEVEIMTDKKMYNNLGIGQFCEVGSFEE